MSGYPFPLPHAAGPDTPWIRSVGPFPGAFPLALGVGAPGQSLTQEGAGLEESTISPGVRSFSGLGPVSRLRTFLGQVDIPDASLKKTTPAGDTP